MADRPTADEAPELDPILENAEQDDEGGQSQTLAEEALRGGGRHGSPLDSEKVGTDPDGDSTQDLIDHMRDMEQSGRIDMGAFAGEPNMDDEEDRYGAGHDPDED
ncbi:MAG: hypothetical protein ABIT09_00620 [Croceibacterium sp.]